MTWIYDERTEHSRLMVAYDRYGITVREWSDETPEGETGYTVSCGWYSWETYRKRERSYAGDDGTGKLKRRIVAGALSLMSYWGPSSDDSGVVSSLGEYLNCGHVFTC